MHGRPPVPQVELFLYAWEMLVVEFLLVANLSSAEEHGRRQPG